MISCFFSKEIIEELLSNIKPYNPPAKKTTTKQIIEKQNMWTNMKSENVSYFFRRISEAPLLNIR